MDHKPILRDEKHPEDPPMPETLKRHASGVIIKEGNRVWIHHPTNQFGGYHATFPKGKIEHGLHPRDNAVKETHEETGLHVKLGKHFGDFERDTSHSRFYEGTRVGGNPANMGWESQAVSLVPIKDLHKHVTHPNDAPIVKKIQQEHNREPEIRTVDFRDKKKSLDEKISYHPEKYNELRDSKQTSGIHTKLLKSSHGLPLDKDTALAVKAYTSAGSDGGVSGQINDHLFTKKGKSTKKFEKTKNELYDWRNDKTEETTFGHVMKHLDKHLSSHEAPHDFHVYSGLHTHDLKAGTEYRHHGYMSSSIDPATAQGFGHSDDEGIHHILKLTIPAGSKHGAYVQPHSSVKTEKEFLIGRGKKIKIHGHEDVVKHLSNRYGTNTIHHRIWHGEIVDG
jgi:8-oxo-dGTP pyrophosphatase MutT (NUDIX family)